MATRFKQPQHHKIYGWYVCTLGGGETMYIHPDGMLHPSTYNTELGKTTGYYETKLEATEILLNYIKNNL